MRGYHILPGGRGDGRVNMKKTLSRYRLFLIMLLADLLLLCMSPELGRKAVSLSGNHLLQMLSVIPPLFLLLGLLDVWVPKETMTKYMGRGAGARGGVLAFLLGSLSAGPLYASFPVAAVFLKKGVSLTNVFIFIGAWSTTKVPMMLFEITQLGMKFALIRFGLNLAAIAAMAVIMEKTASKEEAASICETAIRRADGD